MWVRRVHPLKRRMKRSPLDGCGSVAGHRLPPVAISWVAFHPSFHLPPAWRIGKLAFIPSFVFSSSIVGKWGEFVLLYRHGIGIISWKRSASNIARQGEAILQNQLAHLLCCVPIKICLFGQLWFVLMISQTLLACKTRWLGCHAHWCPPHDSTSSPIWLDTCQTFLFASRGFTMASGRQVGESH